MTAADDDRTAQDPAHSDESEKVAWAEGESPEGADPAGDAEGTDGPGAEAGLQQQLDERTADLQRVSAEFANYRRRVERDRVATVEAAKGAVLAELLPVADDLERARSHGDLDSGPLKAFADRISGLLAAQGVEEFGAEGDAFDPALHEAVQDDSDGGEQVIGTVLRKGYRLGERTLRTAMVTVTSA